jgi:uncharacterized coiled-coil DUF342 family protein
VTGLTVLTSKQMRILDRAIADLGRTDLAELLARLRAARDAEFREHIRELVAEMADSRERRRARINEIRAEFREAKEEWQRQLRTLQWVKWKRDEQGSRHRPRDDE